MKRLHCLICSVNIKFTKTKRGVSLIYGTSAVFALNIFPFHLGLLLWSPSHESRYGHSSDNVCNDVSVTGLVWQFFSFPKITILSAFTVIVSGAKFFHGSTFVWLSANTTFWKIYHHLRIIVNFFLYLINVVWIYL